MNGIIHNCTHGNDQEQSKLTEEEMILRIFAYLDKLFHIVKPQKVMFMAIDGVAPRAKMNQQRARRFKAGREAEEAAQAAARRGEDVEGQVPRFDSNCITPGTPFMARLGAHLRFFIRKKISEDTAWQKPRIVFSGHDVPGEGEHKVMEYIRWARRDSSGYQPNTRHCLYGLDADLIMLSLVTHEPHFCLLREVVSYGSGGRGQPSREVLENPCQEHFVLLQIGLLREYFDIEFRTMAKTLPFEYSLERIIDDFVLFCMLVGNDFLPPLPTVDIAEGSLDTMFALYRSLLPRMGGYLTHAGDLHRGRLEIFMTALAEMEADVLEARAQEAEDQDSRTRSRVDKRSTSKATLNSSSVHQDTEDHQDITQVGHELELLAVVEGEGEGEGLDLEPRPLAQMGPTMMSEEARALFLNNSLGDKTAALAAWKKRYYLDKLGLPHPETQGRAVLESYVQGLHWVLEYYYRGVASWNWFYPYHYAPMASDFTNLASVKVSFSQGTPFSPYEQLLSVQPSASSTLLPQPYRWLMTDPTSPIADFYPTDFRVDLEGKRAAWEGVVLIPFIDETRLRAAARSVPQGALTPEERERNVAGGVLVFNHKEGSKEAEYCTSTLPAHYTSIVRSNSTATLHPPPPPLPLGEKGFVPRIVDGTQIGHKSPAGFPTLKTLAFTAELRKAGINIFGSASKKESLILKLASPPPNVTAAQVGEAIIGRRAWVNWPYLQEAQVVAVTDAQGRATRQQEGEKVAVVKSHTTTQAEEWSRKATTLASEHLVKHGIDVGEIRLLLHVRPCEGLIRGVDGTVEKRFAKVEVVYPLHVTLHKNPAPDPRFETAGFSESWSTFGQNLEVGQSVVFLGRAHYGCSAEVSKVLYQDRDNAGSKPYAILLTPAPPNSTQAAHTARRILSNFNNVNYQPSGQVARKLGVSPRTLGRMTGNVWVKVGEERSRGDRVDIGLCVKNGAKGLFVPDYCIPLPVASNSKDNNENEGRQPSKQKGGWAYSEAMVRVLQQYKQRFPWAWAALQSAEGEGASLEGDRGVIPLEQLLPGLPHDAAMAQVSQLKSWVASQPLARRPLVKGSSQVAPEAAVRMLQSALQQSKFSSKIERIELENVAQALLLPPLERGGPASAFAGGTFEIGDRVVAVGSTGTPPFGTRGTVTAVYDDVIEVLFDGGEFLGGTDLFGRCLGKCGALVLPGELLNLSKPQAVSSSSFSSFSSSSSSSSSTKRSGGSEQVKKVAPKVVIPKTAVAPPASPSKPTGPPPLPPLPSPSLLKSGEEGEGKGDLAKAFWTLLTNAHKK
jgi:5'-3' exoribonuclease 1